MVSDTRATYESARKNNNTEDRVSVAKPTRVQIRSRMRDRTHRTVTIRTNTNTIAIWRTQPSGEHNQGKGRDMREHGRQTDAYRKPQIATICVMAYYSCDTISNKQIETFSRGAHAQRNIKLSKNGFPQTRAQRRP